MNNEKLGCLFSVSAPSGCGKDTVLKKLFEIAPELKFSISCTSRPERDPSDREKYHLVSREKFENMIKNGELLEYNEYNGNFYGTPKAPVEEWINNGYDVVLEIDTNGAANVRREMPQSIAIFIMPPSFGVLKERLEGRGTETAEQIKNRLMIACDELKRASDYDYICINEDITKCAEDILTIIKAQAFTKNNMRKFTEEVEKDAESFNC